MSEQTSRRLPWVPGGGLLGQRLTPRAPGRGGIHFPKPSHRSLSAWSHLSVLLNREGAKGQGRGLISGGIAWCPLLLPVLLQRPPGTGVPSP